MTSLILGGGAAGGIALGGDIGGTNANPQVVGSHFGGVAGDFWVNRGGVWVPDLITSADLPPISKLVNGANTVTLGADGVEQYTADNVTLGALATNVASQYVFGLNSRGYVRVTVSATAVAANATIATVTLTQTLLSFAFITITSTTMTSAQYGDSVAPLTAVSGQVYTRLVQPINSNPSTFEIRCSVALTASTSFGFVYKVHR